METEQQEQEQMTYATLAPRFVFNFLSHRSQSLGVQRREWFVNRPRAMTERRTISYPFMSPYYEWHPTGETRRPFVCTIGREA